MATTYGHNSKISFEYIPETTYGVEPAPGKLRVPSDWIMSCNLEPINNAEVAYSIGSHQGRDIVSGVSEFSLNISYALQRVTTGLSNGSLDTSFEWFAQHKTGSEVSLHSFSAYYTTQTSKRYRLLGCKINTYAASIAADGDHIKVDVNILGKSCSTSVGNYSNYAGSVERATTFETGKAATVTRLDSFSEGLPNFGFTINNGLDKIKIIGTGVKGAYSKNQIVEGTADILVDNGGLREFGDMDQIDKASIVCSSGATTTATDNSIKWTFTNSFYKNFPVNLGNDTLLTVAGVNWGCEKVALDAVT